MLVVDTPIPTGRLLLRPFRRDDLDDVFSYRSRPDVVRYLYTEPLTMQETRELVERRLRMDRVEQEGDGLGLACEQVSSGRMVGDVTLQWRSAEHRQGEVGFVFHPEFGGRGYATEAVKAVLGLAFDRLGLHRVYGRTDARNHASAALMRRLGMRQEAHFKENELFKGAWGDEVVFALLAREWAAQQAAREVL